MADYSIFNSTLSGIGHALRYKLNENVYYKPSQMPTAINNIRTIQPTYPQGTFGQIYRFANGFANYELVSYATGESLIGTDVFKISTGIGGANVYDKTVGDNHYIYSEGDVPIYLASTLQYAPEFFNYYKVNTSFVKVLDFPIMNINNLYNYGFYNVENIYCWHYKYVNDLSGLDKLKIKEFRGGYSVNYFPNVIGLWNYETSENDYYHALPDASTYGRNYGLVANPSARPYSSKIDNTLWCGDSVIICSDMYSCHEYYNWQDNVYSHFNLGTVHANCGKHVLDAFNYCFNRLDLKSAEISSGLIIGIDMYSGCNFLEDVYCNGGNTLCAIKNVYNMFNHAGTNTPNGLYCHFNIDSPFMFQGISDTFPYSHANRLPDIGDTIFLNGAYSIQRFYSEENISYATLTHTPNIGNLILLGSSSYYYTTCNGLNVNKIEYVGNVGDVYSPMGNLRTYPGGCNGVGCFPQNFKHTEQIGNIYAINITLDGSYRGSYSDMFPDSIYPNLEEYRCSIGDLIAEKDILYREQYTQFTCSGNCLAPNLKTAGTHGDIISYNGNIRFSGQEDQGTSFILPYKEAVYNEAAFFPGVKWGNIIAYNGNIFIDYCSGGLLGGASECWSFKNIIAKDISFGGDFQYSGGATTIYGPRRQYGITIDKVIAENNFSTGRSLFSFGYVGSKEYLKYFKRFSSINLIKADNIIMNSADMGGLLYNNYWCIPNLINNEISCIKLIECNNMLNFRVRMSIWSDWSDGSSGNDIRNTTSPYKLCLNIKCSNYFSFGGWRNGTYSNGVVYNRLTDSGLACGHQIYINLYYNQNSASVSPSCMPDGLAAEKWTNSESRNQRIVIRVSGGSPFNRDIYNGGHLLCNDSYNSVWNAQTRDYDYYYDNIFPGNQLTWQHGDNCYYNSVANIWVYYNL